MPYLVPYIETLRRKPEHVRRTLAMAITLIVTFFIFLFWAVTLSFNQRAVQEPSAVKGSGPIDKLVLFSTDQIKNVSLGVAQIKSLLDNRVVITK